MSPADRSDAAYVRALLVLTAATGAVDAVSYLALDRVFTGNMTGNVLFLGFGLVGVPGLPVVNNLVALLTFALGAALGARLTRTRRGRARLPAASMRVLLSGTVLVFGLAAVWLVVGRLGTPQTIVVTGLLALLLGAQAAAVKHTGLRDLSTVVVTMTLVNLSTDSRLAGSAGTSWGRRLAAIVAMGIGALASAAMVRQLSGAYALLLGGLLMSVGVTLLGRARAREIQRATRR